MPNCLAPLCNLAAMSIALGSCRQQTIRTHCYEPIQCRRRSCVQCCCKVPLHSACLPAGAPVVGSAREPLDFNSMAGQTEYLVAVQRLYKELQSSWLTPVGE
jgi:hypothetical protein